MFPGSEASFTSDSRQRMQRLYFAQTTNLEPPPHSYFKGSKLHTCEDFHCVQSQEGDVEDGEIAQDILHCVVQLSDCHVRWFQQTQAEVNDDTARPGKRQKVSGLRSEERKRNQWYAKYFDAAVA